jgi:hypothetical protein
VEGDDYRVKGDRCRRRVKGGDGVDVAGAESTMIGEGWKGAGEG